MSSTRGRTVARTALRAVALAALVVAFLAVIGTVAWLIREPAPAAVLWPAVVVVGAAALVAAGTWFAASKIRVD
jgi:hypothetical protein